MAKQINYLGIDIGGSGVKVVELANEAKRGRLLTYGFSERKESFEEYSSKSVEEKAKEVKDVCARSGILSKRVVAGLPMSDVFSTIFTFPELPDKELAPRVKEKAKTIVPFEESDLVLDWKKIGKNEDGSIKVSVTAASKKNINSHVEIFKGAGLDVANLETEGFAMVRSLLGKDLGLAMIVDIGASKSNVMVIKDGVPFIHKTIKQGGEELTQELSAKTGFENERAEILKRALSEKPLTGAGELLKHFVAPIINEITYCQGLYGEQYNNVKIEKIVLTGGSSSVVGLVKVIGEATGLRVFLGDPWARIIYPQDLRKTLDEIGPKMSVAIGLALRDFI